jgi:hypothetical protein
MKKELPGGVIIGALAIVVVVVGFLLFKGATGGVQGDGRAGQILADPFPRGAGSTAATKQQQAWAAQHR